MNDPTEKQRREEQAEINAAQATRFELECRYGRVWDTHELQQDYEVQGFAAPLVIVIRKADGARGTMYFQHSPRFYFDFQKV